MAAPRKKLIEVALPLEAINAESSRRKQKAPKGYPTAIHKWWAQVPIASCRAVLFGSWLTTRPPGRSASRARKPRAPNVSGCTTSSPSWCKWENSNNERMLNRARWYIARSLAWGRGDEPPPEKNPEAVSSYLLEHAPPVYDPFCGGGSIPLEAQRLGLRAYGSDLNPVAVMISKALVEFPPKFAGLPPVNPESRKKLANGGTWNAKGAQGLAEDVRYYGRWMRDEAEKRIGHLYPHVELPDGSKATVIAWLWARTVGSPNPPAAARTCRWFRALCSRTSRAERPGSSRCSILRRATATDSRCGPGRSRRPSRIGCTKEPSIAKAAAAC